MMPITGRTERVDSSKSDEILATLLSTTQGPAEAYAVLVLAIYRLNFEFNDNPITLCELADSISKSVLSIQKAPRQ
jgi:hypothetical protein